MVYFMFFMKANSVRHGLTILRDWHKAHLLWCKNCFGCTNNCLQSDTESSLVKLVKASLAQESVLQPSTPPSVDWIFEPA